MKIGLTYTGTEWKHENYVRWLQGRRGLLPEARPEEAAAGDDARVIRMGGKSAVVRSLHESVEPVEVIRVSAGEGNFSALEDCDGLVLSGGIDIHPALYGGSLEYTKAPEQGWEKKRDLFERAALEQAWARGLPVLGVCRGLQLINITLKGTLVQDLGDTGDAIHERDRVDKRHPVHLVADTLLAAVTGLETAEANSAHHQAIDRLGEGLVVNCRAGDGTIEGIEWSDPAGRSFMLAVQWHPERMFMEGMSDAGLYRAIRERFIQEIMKKRG
jgi:putative glutamine amidotransferase